MECLITTSEILTKIAHWLETKEEQNARLAIQALLMYAPRLALDDISIDQQHQLAESVDKAAFYV